MRASRETSGMSTAEFLTWKPTEHQNQRWQLVNGLPVCMAPNSENHGALQAEATYKISDHLEQQRSGCRVIIAPGLVPGVRSTSNFRIPALGVTSADPSDSQITEKASLVVEILSQSNVATVRENYWAFQTITSVEEILLLHGSCVGADLLRRDSNGDWPATTLRFSDGDDIELVSIGFVGPLRSFYRTTSIVPNGGETR